MIFAGPWCFRPEEVVFEKVFLWQGEQDQIMPVAAARMLAQGSVRTQKGFRHGGHSESMLVRSEHLMRSDP
jgi:hypothetical protein